MITKRFIFVQKWRLFLLWKFEVSLSCRHIPLIRVKPIGHFSVALQTRPHVFAHFSLGKWKSVNMWKAALFSFLKTSPLSLWWTGTYLCALTAAVFASVTASRWRSLFSSPASLAFPYSPVARLSPYSNGVSSPSSSKTSNKAILTPERTGNLSPSWPAACFAPQSWNTTHIHLPWGSWGGPSGGHATRWLWAESTRVRVLGCSLVSAVLGL